MNKEEFYVCALDCYFEAINDDSTYYKINDEELSKLIVRIRQIEFERDSIKNAWRRYKKIYDEEIKKLKHEKHVYKVELKRCVRKLTRIYEKKMQIAELAYSLGNLPEKPHEYVDRWRQM